MKTVAAIGIGLFAAMLFCLYMAFGAWPIWMILSLVFCASFIIVLVYFVDHL